MSTLSIAIELATQAHEDQVDKAGQPYILHPLRVMLTMNSDKERIVAVLHDILEDTLITAETLLMMGFDVEIVEGVTSLTRKENESYMEFITRVKKNDLGRKVKIADLKDNMNLDRILEPTVDDMKRMEKYNKALRRLCEH